MYVATASASWWRWFVKTAASGAANAKEIAASSTPAAKDGTRPTPRLRRTSPIRPLTR
jgi:hypothetical protein